MRMSISRKLIGGFLVLALLVLIAGLVGIIVLNKVSTSADTVALEKAPAQYAVMNSALALDTTEKHILEYSNSSFQLESIEQKINDGLSEFDMWLTMLQYGTNSSEFSDSPAHAVYQAKNLTVNIPRSSEEMLPIVTSINEESRRFKEKTAELLASHRQQVSYGVVVEGRLLGLPEYLNLSQRYHLEWVKQLRDAVNIETTFSGNTDPTKELIGSWLETYQVPNQELMTVLDKFKKQYTKLMELAEATNKATDIKQRQKNLGRTMAPVARLEGYFNELHAIGKQITEELDVVEKAKHTELSQSAEKINEQLASLVTIASAEMKSALEQAAAARKGGVTLLIVITIVAVIAAALLGTLVSRFMSAKIKLLADSAKRIAGGDLQQKLEITSNDELGDLASDTNAMINNLQQMIGQIHSFSSNLTNSADDLAGVSKNLDSDADELSNKSHTASDATEAMNSSMREISALANESMQRVQSVASATEEMSSTITEIAQNAEQARTVTNKAVSTVENTTLKMNELSEAANEIGKVADVIVNIAEQTNLLSLNATIEAARAGEAGKGFAVVANEVKELAGQTNKATEDIRQKIAAIQQSSNMTIAEITEITGIINDINAIVVMIAGAVEEQAATTKQITDDINSVSSGIEGMTEHVESAAQISVTVGDDINQVKTTSSSIGEGSGHIRESATKLEQLAEELNRLVGQFKL